MNYSKNILLSREHLTRVCFRVVFADRSSYQNCAGTPAATIIFKNRRAEWNALLFGHVGLMESYSSQIMDVEGSLPLALRAGMDMTLDQKPNPLVSLRNRWHEFRFSNKSHAQAKANARFHYGLGTDFYRAWLDLPAMMYTCAYWKEGTRDLEQAQRNKMEHVCQKIRLKPGETVVDIGCGWGGFMFHAWENHSAPVTGINTTTEQVTALQEEINRRGLQGQLAVREQDFREIQGQFDKCVSIGVLEHAGPDQLREVIRAHADCLKPGGLGVLHFIGHVGRSETEFYIRKHIFPGGWIPSLADAICAMEDCGLEVMDVENLRRHYALTLDCWAERFDRNWEHIHQLNPEKFNEYFRRKWRIYLYACAEMFRSPKSRTHLFQITFSKGNVADNYPMSRAFLYDASEDIPQKTSYGDV